MLVVIRTLRHVAVVSDFYAVAVTAATGRASSPSEFAFQASYAASARISVPFGRTTRLRFASMRRAAAGRQV